MQCKSRGFLHCTCKMQNTAAVIPRDVQQGVLLHLLCNGKAGVSRHVACRSSLRLDAHACRTLQPSQALQQCQASCRPGSHHCKDFLRCKKACAPSQNSCQLAPIHHLWMITRTWWASQLASFWRYMGKEVAQWKGGMYTLRSKYPEPRNKV